MIEVSTNITCPLDEMELEMIYNFNVPHTMTRLDMKKIYRQVNEMIVMEKEKALQDRDHRKRLFVNILILLIINGFNDAEAWSIMHHMCRS